MGKVNLYSVFVAETGEQLMTGTAGECADRLGVEPKKFKIMASQDASETGLDIRLNPNISDTAANFIRDWDTMCIKLRKQFGVKVKRVEEKENA